MFCTKCGKETDGKSNFCNYCGATLNNKTSINTQQVNQSRRPVSHSVKVKKKIYQQWWFWVIIVILGIGIVGGLGSDTTQTTSSKNTVENNITQKEENSTVEEKKESKEEYISKCEKYTYKEIARNPNNYKGKRAKFTGEVIQVQEGILNNVTLRINVTKDEYGLWQDTIWIDYKYADSNESKILENDIVTIYGEIQGQKSYTSILGAQITIPQVQASYIDIN